MSKKRPIIVSTSSSKLWLLNPNLRESGKETIEHQVRDVAQVMAIRECLLYRFSDTICWAGIHKLTHRIAA